MAATNATPPSRPETIYLRSGSRNGKTEHWSADCPEAAKSDRLVAKPAAAIPEGHYNKCSRCTDAPRAPPAGGDGGYPTRKTSETCPHGDPLCQGERDLQTGRLPCKECADAASHEDWETFIERRRARDDVGEVLR